MNISFPNLKNLVTGGSITIVLALVFRGIGLITNIDSTLEKIIIFSFWWLVLSFLIQNILYFKRNRSTVYKVVGLSLVVIAAMAVDNYMEIPDNPITLSIVILSWLGLAYLILPQFFKKYKVAILSVYGAVLFYFLISRMTSNYLEDHHQKVVIFILIPIPVLIVLWIYEQWRWMKTLKVDKGRAELALLKSQINPHFFFNTLNNLYGLVVEKSEKAPAVVLKLSDMMRYTIYEGKEDWVALKEEIGYLENYIELHKIRYQKKVDVVFTYQTEDNIRVAPLLFIILLENAFKHGVEGMTQNAYIHLDLQAQNNHIAFTIENNFETANFKKASGIGLDNLKKRLAHIYPKKYELMIKQDASIYRVQLNLELT